MRNSSVKTPKNKKSKDDSVQADKSSGKKMVQARLPFKIITTSPGGTSDEKVKASGYAEDGQPRTSRELKKRKLSISDSGEDEKVELQSTKENVDVATKKKKVESGEEKKVTQVEPVEEVIVLDDEEPEEPKASVSSHTPKSKAEGSAKKASQTGKNKRKSDAGSAQKLQIKISVSNKKKRRKSKRDSIAAENEKDVEDDKDRVVIESSDDSEAIASELNPGKKQKIDQNLPKTKVNEKDDEKLEAVETSEDDMKENKNDPQKSVDDVTIVESDQGDVKELKSKSADNNERIAKLFQKRSEAKMNFVDSSTTTEVVTDATDREADDESDVMIKSDSSDVAKAKENTTDMSKGESSEVKDIKSGMGLGKSNIKKPLTPKQQKLMEQRKQAREEKERKLQEEKLKKQREKEEREQERKREREEKNQKRLAELEAKNDEKRKRMEAKEEELRKKEEERKRKEQEKEEAKLKEKKAAEAFTKFFVAKGLSGASTMSQDDAAKGSKDADEQVLAFRPFQVKGDMKMAPLVRKEFSQEAKEHLDECLMPVVDTQELPNRSNLYLGDLKSGRVIPNRCKRRSIEKEDDDVIFADDLERAGQAIVEEAPVPVERFRAKFYKFHDNRRPPYFGTWRKKTMVITPRRPFTKDQKFFDYEVDSDLEWEDEEPGESLDGSDDDKEKESEEDEYEVDNEWFVPHGHLSEEELQNEDEFGLDETTREAQKAKLKLLQQEFAQEMKKKTEKIKPRLIGCIWADENGNQPEDCPNIIWEVLAQRSILFTESPIVEEPTVPEKEESNSPTQVPEKAKPMELSEGHLKDLVRLLHGNRNSKVFLIKEFQAHVNATEETVKSGEVRGPLKASLQKKIDELAEWSIMEVDGKNNRNKIKKRLCWVVAKEVLKKMELEGLSLQNKWSYTLEPKFKNSNNNDAAEVATTTVADDAVEDADNEQQTARSKSTTASEKKAKRVSEANKSVQQKKLVKTIQTNGAADAKPAPAAPVVKKRVPILMSVPRGEKIPTAAKNALISQYLKAEAGGGGGGGTVAAPGDCATGASADDDVIVLD